MTDTQRSGFAKLTASIKAAGCAAKMSPTELAEVLRALPSLSSPNLLTGMENFEDAAVYKITEDIAIIQTTDFFPPVVDDPYTFGRIAAVNALSDVYAMGGAPILALNILCFPTCDYPLSVAREILRGGADTVAEAGAVMAGGHSIQLPEPIYGLCVTGVVHPARMLTNSGARVGDVVVLSKPVGTGVGLLGLKGGQLSETQREELIRNLTTLNNRSLEIALRYQVHAATDVTGFGLIGHLHEMACASGLEFALWADSVPLLPGTQALAQQGFVPAAAYSNRRAYQPFVNNKIDVDESLADLLYDPQTAGGLLFCVDQMQAENLLQELQQLEMTSAAIGTFRSGTAGAVEIGVRSGHAETRAEGHDKDG